MQCHGSCHWCMICLHLICSYYLMQTGSYNITARLMPFVNCLPSLRLMLSICLPWTPLLNFYGVRHRNVRVVVNINKTFFPGAVECVNADKMNDKCKETCMHANQRILLHYGQHKQSRQQRQKFLCQKLPSRNGHNSPSPYVYS